MPVTTYTHTHTHIFSLKMHFWHFYTSGFLPCVQLPSALPSSLESSVVVAARGAGRLRRVGIAFWFPQSLLSGSRRDFSLIVTTGVVLWIRGAHKRWWGLMPGAGVGECSWGTGRVQNKEFSGSKGVGKVDSDWGWTYGWNWSSRKVPTRDQGGRNCQSRQRNKSSGKWKWREGFGDWYSCWALSRSEYKTKPSLFCLHAALVQLLKCCI